MIEENINSNKTGTMVNNNPSVIKAGWMRKKSNKLNVWGERYFLLKDSTLSYYLKQRDPEPKDSLTLHPLCRVSEIKSDVTKKRKQFLFKVVFPSEAEIEEG